LMGRRLCRRIRHGYIVASIQTSGGS
jgi:hypothetical protein